MESPPLAIILYHLDTRYTGHSEDYGAKASGWTTGCKRHDCRHRQRLLPSPQRPKYMRVHKNADQLTKGVNIPVVRRLGRTVLHSTLSSAERNF